MNPGAIALSPDGNTVYIYDWGANAVFVLPASGGTPSVLASYAATQFPGLQQARFMTISPDGQTLYLAGWGSGTIFSVSVASGACVNLAPGVPLVMPHGITISPDGNTLYFADGGGGASGRVRSLPTSGGTPAMLNPDLGFNAPGDLAISPSGDMLFMIDYFTKTVYRMALTGGTLTAMVSALPLVRPTGVAISRNSSTLIIVDDAAMDGRPTAAV